jgi:hypothetical protein
MSSAAKPGIRGSMVAFCTTGVCASGISEVGLLDVIARYSSSLDQAVRKGFVVDMFIFTCVSNYTGPR